MAKQDLTYKEAAEALDTLFQKQGIKAEVGQYRFSKKSPFPNDDGKSWPHFSYEITFSKVTGSFESRKIAELITEWHAGASKEEEFGRTLHYQFPRTPKKERRPKPYEVFADLCRNALDARGQTFGEWAVDFGYDKDSRKAEKTYLLCQSYYSKLCQFVDHVTMQEFADLYSML